MGVWPSRIITKATTRCGTKKAERISSASPFRLSAATKLHSVSKSIVGLLYGIAQREGKVPPLDEPLLAQFPNYTDLPNLEQRRRWSRVRGTFRAPSPAGSFLGGFRTTALVLAAPSRWAVIRNPEHKRQSV